MNHKPNILLIVTDQLTWRALPHYGNEYCKTPNIDRIMKSGVSFDSCYTTCPLCQPARASLWTGRYPHEMGILTNRNMQPLLPLAESTPALGELFLESGYETVHFGKTHDAGSLRGFHIETQDELPVEGTPAWPASIDTVKDRYTTERAVEYLQKKQDKPFCMVVDLVNPHDICSWVGYNQGIHEDIPIDGPLPPLTDNFEFDDIDNRPLPVQYICCTHKRQAQAAGWTRENYRHYLAAYYYYIQVVDKEIGLVLNALEKRGDAGNTLIAFTADHGDSMTAHGLVTKQLNFYEEITRIPLAFSGQGITGGGRMVRGSLVSLVDILPTLCDFAQIEIPEGLWGKSLMPWLRDPNRTDCIHPYIASEWHAIAPGRMVRTAGNKYIRYVEEYGEEFYDLSKDPGEKMNLIKNPEYSEFVNEHRKLLEKHCEETKDDFFHLSWMSDSRWRSHAVGYHHHTVPV